MNNISFTENGAVALKTSYNKNLDFFVKVTRGCAVETYVDLFVEAYKENPYDALRVLLNLRDCRDGKGERLIPQTLMFYLKITAPELYKDIIKDYVKYGYFKDLLVIMEMTIKWYIALDGEKDTSNETIFRYNLKNMVEYDIWIDQLTTDIANLRSKTNAPISMAAKYAPSEKCHYDKHPLHFGTTIGIFMAKRKGETSKEMKTYRVMLSELRAHLNLIETNLSTGKFDKIEFNHIPSIAHHKLADALKRKTNANNDISDERTMLAERYNNYLLSLKNKDKDVKINSKGLQPHMLVEKYLDALESDQTIESQWEGLVDDIRKTGVFKQAIAMSDVSGSMKGEPMTVSIALGILVSMCTESPFNGHIMTFETHPKFIDISKEMSLFKKVKKVANAPWGGSTNIEAAFDLLLTDAKRYKLSPDQMIKTVFIFTDMQFDSANGGNETSTTLQNIKAKYKQSGYDVPTIVCWNLRSSTSQTMPCEQDTPGLICLSGFSSSLMKQVVTSNIITPYNILMNVLDQYSLALTEFPALNTERVDTTILAKIVESIIPKNSFKK